MGVETPSAAAHPALRHLRAASMGLAAAGAGLSTYEFQVSGREPNGWWLIAASLLLAVVGQSGLRYAAPAPAPPPERPSAGRRVLGCGLALLGAALWALATHRIYRNWAAGFDFAWAGWTAGTVLLGIGLDLAWGAWPRPRRRRVGLVLVATVLLVVAGVYRLGNIADFPGEAAVTQIEDLQVGNFGNAYLNGYRLRWEYLSSTWLAALGIWLGGPTQLAVRVPFAVVSALKVLPLFVWLRFSVGTAGAVAGTALLACSFWDTVLSRIPNNHNALIIAIVFALLAGPVRRGRPSAYVALGFFGGYVLHEYIAYRPLVAWAVAGALLWSLRDRAAGWAARLARPAITVALVATMVAPLFLARIPGRVRAEYFDGWNRAHGTGYYDPADTWKAAFEKRLGRSTAAAELFVARGDRSPVRNIGGRPLIDPVACALLILGIAGATANALRPVFGLTLLGLAVHVAGTLIATGNFDVARVGGAVAYVYALAGFGAGGLYAAWSAAWGRAGRWLAAAVLVLAVAGAAYWNTTALMQLWTSEPVRRSHRNNLAYLSIWLREHVKPGERVLGIAPAFTNVLEGHDGGWLRGGPVPGFVAADIESALREWPKEGRPTLLFVLAGDAAPFVTEYLEWLLPGVKFELDPDPLGMHADVAWARVPGPPPQLVERLTNWHCRGVEEEFTVVGDREQVLHQTKAVGPFISRLTWPSNVGEGLLRARDVPSRIRARYRAAFKTGAPGEYRFELETYAGSGRLTIDGEQRDASGRTPTTLAAGIHFLELNAEFAAQGVEPNIALYWSGPDTADRRQLMPLYRLALTDPSCAEAAGQEPFVNNPSGRPKRYLTSWLAAGPFANPEGAGLRRHFLDVASLSVAPRDAAVAGIGWQPVPPHDAFVDLDRFFAERQGPDSASPEWVCAYAATTLRSAAPRAAFLELAGSADPVLAWLNGRELTAGPLTAGYEPQRRPIELRAGANLLVVKSCESIGAWYIVARVTDGEGRDVADLESHAALPDEPIPLPPVEPGLDLQLVDGFAEIVRAPHTQPAYGDYRGGTQSWWAYAEDKPPEVEWRTAPLAVKKRTVLAVTASTSPENGRAALSVNGREALDFQIGAQGVGGRWSANGYQVAFVSKGFFAGNSGILLISVPPDLVTPGEPLDLRVALTGDSPRTWFMVKDYRDILAHEQLTVPEVAGLLNGLWSRVQP